MPRSSRQDRPNHPGHPPSAPLSASEQHSQQYSPPPSAQYSQLDPSPSPPPPPPPPFSSSQPKKATPPPSIPPQQKPSLPPHTASSKRHTPSHPPAPRIRFDPWNSSSSGHQTDNHNRLAGSTTWRAARTAKLARQFEGGGIGDSGGVRVEKMEGKDRDKDEKRGGGDSVDAVARGESEKRPAISTAAGTATTATTATSENQPTSPAPARKRKIFHGLQMYINGSTAPLVSDHRLKQLLVQHGAGVCISLARRTVTHVILGTPNGGEGGRGGGGGSGAGGGLSARKMQKEISRVRGCGVKYVGVEWILQSIQAGHRLPEARFSLHPAVMHQVRVGGSKGLSHGSSQGQNQRLSSGQKVRQKSVYEVFGGKLERGGNEE